MDDPDWKLDDYSLKPMTPLAHHTVESGDVDCHNYAHSSSATQP